MFNRFIACLAACFFSLAFSVSAYAHHNSPDEIYDFITDQLIEADSPHLLSSEDDPSLMDEMGIPDDMLDVDLIYIVTDLSADELTAVLEDILEQLVAENEVCDTSYVISYDMDTRLFTLTIYVDYCDI